MNVALRQRLSLAEFLAGEERQGLRYEFDGFHVDAMLGGTAARSTMQHPRATVVTDPGVIFEILSDSTARSDHIDKNADYRATRSVQRSVMLKQDSQAATVPAREADCWVGTLPTGEAVLAMPGLGIELPLAELYEGLDLSPPTAEAFA